MSICPRSASYLDIKKDGIFLSNFPKRSLVVERSFLSRFPYKSEISWLLISSLVANHQDVCVSILWDHLRISESRACSNWYSYTSAHSSVADATKMLTIRVTGIWLLRMKMMLVVTADVPHMMEYATQSAQAAIDCTVENALLSAESARRSDINGYTVRGTSPRNHREEDVVAFRPHPTPTSVEFQSMCLLWTSTLFHRLTL